MTEGAERVLDLLNYIEQVEKLKAKPTFVVPSDGHFVAYRNELQELPDIEFNLQAEGDDVWLRIPRLQEIPAPEPDEVLKPWITVSKSADKRPEIKAEAMLAIEEAPQRHALADHPEIKEHFDWYVEYMWEPWAATERIRRKCIAQYNRLFALQQAISSDTETPLELVWGIGYAAWKKDGSPTVKHPLLVQVCDVSLNEKTLALEVRPRDIEPRLEVDCYSEMELPGVKQLEAHWRAFLGTTANRVNPFDLPTFDGILKVAVGHLDSSGIYETRDPLAQPIQPTEHLKITDCWVVFGRKRSGDIFLADIRRLKEKVQQATELPAVIRRFVEPGADEVKVRPEQPYRGLSTSDAGQGASELYFPMPYNDEQVSIVQKLHANEGVVVQGPPGTGKTHTIANVICHYLAQGKRVLVTANGESPLAVLQEKLPERIRPLSVALLSDERDGMKQFEHSIQTIANSVGQLQVSEAQAKIREAEAQVDQLHAKIAAVDQAVAQHAAKHMGRLRFQGKELTPEELARAVLEQAETHAWFDDQPKVIESLQLPFTDADISGLRRARMAIGASIGYVSCTLPNPGASPQWPELLTLHRDLVAGKAIEAGVSTGAVLPLVNALPETFAKAKTLLDFLHQRLDLCAKLAGKRKPWFDVFSKRLAKGSAVDDVLAALFKACEEIRVLEQERRARLALAIDIPADVERNEDFCAAIARLMTGKGGFVLPFGKADARKLVAAVTLSGVAPASSEDWKAVADLVQWRTAVRKLLARWGALGSEVGLSAAAGDQEHAFKELVDVVETLQELRQLAAWDAQLPGKLEEVFGGRIAGRFAAEGEALLQAGFTSLQAHIDKGRLGYALLRVQDVLALLAGHSGAVVQDLRAFLTDALGHEGADEGTMQARWMELQEELTRLTALAPHFETVRKVTAAMDDVGAIKWARRCRTQPASADLDITNPTSWADAWDWRQAVMYLDSIDGHQTLRGLFDQRRSLTMALARAYGELVAEKTWLEVHRNSPERVRQSLQEYLNAIQAMGSGTGVRAVRHRKTARDAMTRAYKAVPCWVLPQWRVSEAIPAELGLFDLVVIDEASQSDIWALPALLRGKQVLVVGDHKQVSPSAVGTAEEKIKELVSRFLVNQPFGSQMTPDRSIYDLARVVFADNSVMLKEHFRCVPAIIEYSNREFYQNEIRPLRVPRANERLDPPLVDVFVKGGNRKADVNKAEAEAIAQEVEAILADPQMDGRSIGVVTLVGTAQAKYLSDLIDERISKVDVVQRKIAVGPPPVFQGRERDIMLVSMVLGPDDRAIANRADMHQRFNVAMSRARDRMYLFRSVADSQFSEESLNGRLLRHFKQPFHQDVEKVKTLRELCESGFEREMYDELTRRGYRVQPQVPCGGFRIDFVVEGENGKRLAVECDGDKYHGPGHWQHDMARQRVLERAGWSFWRCFASTFVRRREEVLADLLQTLAAHGVQPIGVDGVDSSSWVSSKEVDPFQVTEPAADDAASTAGAPQ